MIFGTFKPDHYIKIASEFPYIPLPSLPLFPDKVHIVEAAISSSEGRKNDLDHCNGRDELAEAIGFIQNLKNRVSK